MCYTIHVRNNLENAFIIRTEECTMIITTKRLQIICTIASGEWVDISIYPNCKRDAKILDAIVLLYDENTIESDVDICEIIAIFNGESTWCSQFLSGDDLESTEDNSSFFPYSISPIIKRAAIGQKLDHFIVTWDSFWDVGIPEIKFLKTDFTFNGEISLRTLMRLEALKRVRQAITHSSAKDLA